MGTFLVNCRLSPRLVSSRLVVFPRANRCCFILNAPGHGQECFSIYPENLNKQPETSLVIPSQTSALFTEQGARLSVNLFTKAECLLSQEGYPVRGSQIVGSARTEGERENNTHAGASFSLRSFPHSLGAWNRLQEGQSNEPTYCYCVW